MMHPSATPYSSLPAMPGINAMPKGIPYGPWSHLYRAAPGAQIPAVRYPGMHGAIATIQGALGAPPAVIQGFGQNGEVQVKLGMGSLLLGVVLSAGYGAAMAMTIKSKHPVRNTALLTGGSALVGGLLTAGLTMKASTTQPAA